MVIDGVIDYMENLEYLHLAGRCSSAMEAIKSIKEQEVDLMFLDISMPRLSGRELLESLDSSGRIFSPARTDFASIEIPTQYE